MNDGKWSRELGRELASRLAKPNMRHTSGQLTNPAMRNIHTPPTSLHAGSQTNLSIPLSLFTSTVSDRK